MSFSFFRCLGLCLRVIAGLLIGASFARADELRGLWVDAFGPGFLNHEQVQRLASDCRKYNFNAVFVQMRKRGDAYYSAKPPNQDPKSKDIAADFDALDEIIKECHGKEPRIQVHCWVVTYFVWAWERPPREKEHIFNQHPDYLTKDSIGQKFLGKGYYLDPGHPGVGTELLNVAKDIVGRYDIDGLHWDYLRYPEQDSGYNETALKRYKQEFGVTKDPVPSDPQFCDWRRRQVTDFLRWSTAELLEMKPQLTISASVFSNYKDSRDARFADWVDWSREGLVDVVVPMDFSADNRFIFEPRAQFALTNQWNRAVWLGQASYMSSKEATVKQLHFCRSKGCVGTVLYSYRKPANGVALVLGEEEETTEVASPVGMIIDNEQAQVIGSWQTGEYGKSYGDNYLFRGKGTGQNIVRFATNLPTAGDYEVYEWHVAGPNRAQDAPFFVIHDGVTNALAVDQQRNGGRWNLLGKYRFETNVPAEVRVTDAIQTQGKMVVADAVRFSPAGGSKEKGQNKAAVSRAAQESVLAFIRDHNQPAWESAPVLSWKQKPSCGAIKGTIADEKGEPVFNATVELLGESRPSQKTEPHGKFAFFDVPPGEHRVKATFHDGSAIDKKTNAKGGRVSSVDIVEISIKPTR